MTHGRHSDRFTAKVAAPGALARATRLALVAATYLALAVTAAGCRSDARPMHPANEPGRWYVVGPGETLGDIAARVGVPEEDLLEVNGFKSAAEVHPGKLIFVLNGPKGAIDEGDHADEASVADDGNDARVGTSTGGGAPGTDEARPGGPGAAPSASARRSRFRWPVESPRVTSLFGSRWGRPHEGIDLTAPIGTPVFAVDTGDVVYAGNAIRGYGNMIVLKHTGELMTVYAHNSVLLVKVGDHVETGQRIALSGQSGHATGPHVHFEVRRGQVPRDPLPYLPKKGS